MNAFCASENLDAFIVFRSSQPGNQTRKTLAKNGPVYWEQITSTVHVNRSLMELRGNGFITLEKQTLTILKWNELQRYAQFDPLYLHMETTAEAA